MHRGIQGPRAAQDGCDLSWALSWRSWGPSSPEEVTGGGRREHVHRDMEYPQQHIPLLPFHPQAQGWLLSEPAPPEELLRAWRMLRG